MGTYEKFARPEQACTAPTATVVPPTAESISHLAQTPVSQDRQAEAGTPLTEEARELAIAQAEAAEARHDVLWVLTGCFAAKGDADRARRLKEQLIAGRRKD